jgi:hypothetical protein
MESMYGMENMSKCESGARMNKAYEKEVLNVARVSYEVRDAGLTRPSWFCPLLVWLGEKMVHSGNRLKVQNSPRPSVRAR